MGPFDRITQQPKVIGHRVDHVKQSDTQHDRPCICSLAPKSDPERPTNPLVQETCCRINNA
jgi:hypothetical protein